ncbi:MAG: hypothetical protein R3178_06840 [Rhodothermales bacterium]|nr:hypothetical protein [Rhodothermales bacterium]
MLFGLAAEAVRAQDPAALDPSRRPATSDVVVVSRAALEAAMRAEAALPYDGFVTTNAARYFAGVVYRLAREAIGSGSAGIPLLLRHDDWFEAYLSLSGLDAGEAPLHVRLAFDHRQDALIEYGVDRVVKSVRDGVPPDLAVNLQIGWPESSDLPDQYSYEDTLSKPQLKVTNHRLIKYRLVYFGDVTVYDEMSGLSGRPTSGLLSLLFRVIGEGRAHWTRFLIARDGTQLGRGRAKKGPFAVTETFHVQPDGTANKGLPDESPEWMAAERRLKNIPDIEYHEWTLPDFDVAWHDDLP